MKNNIRSNFDMLHAYEAQLWRLGSLSPLEYRASLGLTA